MPDYQILSALARPPAPSLYGAPAPTLAPGMAAYASVSGGTPAALVHLHAGTAFDPFASGFKGRATETFTSRAIARGFLEGTGWTPLTPRTGPQGIDGLFIKMGRGGRIEGLLVAETKFGTSRLGHTRTGPQMSRTWIETRLRGASAQFSDLAGRLPAASLSARAPFPTDRPVVVAIGPGRTAKAWMGSDGKLRVYAPGATLGDVQRSARSAADYLRAAAEGRAPYRSSLIRAKSAGGHPSVMIDALDANGRIVRGSTASARLGGRHGHLPERLMSLMERSIQREFEALGLTPRDARAIARRAARDPEYLRTMRATAAYSRSAGFDAKAIWTGVGAAVGAMLIDVALTLFSGREVDWKATAVRAGMTGFSAGAGYVVGMQVHALLVGTAVGRNLLAALPRAIAGVSPASFAGSAAGGAFAATAYVAGLWLLGMLDDRTAGRMLSAQVGGAAAGAAAAAGVFGATVAFGTAGTGAAISGLSGAAMTNAALASIGGGTIASGGGGMALGATVLSGGTMAVAMVAAVAIGAVYKGLDERERRHLLEGRLDLVAQRVGAGHQVEWEPVGLRAVQLPL